AAPVEGIPPMGNEAIDSSIASVENLVSNDQLYGATLIGWATFEALGRALSPAKFARPKTPARLIEILAADGTVTPSEADLLRRLARSRTRVMHGTLNEKIEKGDLSKFLNVLRELRRMMQVNQS